MSPRSSIAHAARARGRTVRSHLFVRMALPDSTGHAGHDAARVRVVTGGYTRLAVASGAATATTRVASKHPSSQVAGVPERASHQLRTRSGSAHRGADLQGLIRDLALDHGLLAIDHETAVTERHDDVESPPAGATVVLARCTHVEDPDVSAGRDRLMTGVLVRRAVLGLVGLGSG